MTPDLMHARSILFDLVRIWHPVAAPIWGDVSVLHYDGTQCDLPGLYKSGKVVCLQFQWLSPKWSAHFRLDPYGSEPNILIKAIRKDP